MTPSPLVTLSPPQAIFIIGGMLNILFSSLVGYMVLWVRTRDPKKPVSRYSMVTHNAAIMNGTLLIALSVAIQYTPFIEPVKIGLALAEVLATTLSAIRNVVSWNNEFNDAIGQGSSHSNRLRGLGNIFHLFNAAAILYGVVRVAFGI